MRCTLATPAREASPMEPRERLTEALGLFASLTVASAPTMLRIFLSLF